MDTLPKVQDRRKHNRVNVNSGVVALLNHKVYQIGELLDIGLGGLAMRYTGDELTIDHPFVLDVMIMGQDDVYLRRVPGEIICSSGANGLPNGARRLMRCGISFSLLSEDQETMLQSYIEETSMMIEQNVKQ